MNDQPERDDDQSAPKSTDDTGQFTQRVRYQQVSARVPEHIGKGIYATGALVLNGPHEFIIDFIQTVTRPHQVNARVILPTTILDRMVQALKQNIETYTERFGPPPELPKPAQPKKPPTVEEIYEHLKLPEEIAGGVYANTVMITHAPAEFCFDFIASFYPRSSVNCRIFMSVPQVPRLLTTLTQSLEQHKRKFSQKPDPQDQPPTDPPASPGPDLPPSNN